jgi:HAD-superfamily hydrolase, subfamily IIB
MKVVVTDLDGTLLRSDKSISKRTIDVLSRLNSNNINFVIATARARRSVSGLLPFDFENMYVACCNGAEIYHKNKLIYHKYMEESFVKDFVICLSDSYPNINIALEISDCLYTSFDIKIMNNWYPSYTQVDFYSFDYKPAAKILVDLRSVQNASEIVERLPQNYKCVITDGGTLAQISHRDVSKLNAIRDISKILNCELKDIVAFGDDYNDIEMLTGCGKGVAMANAPEEIRGKVSCVTLSNDEDGVAVELEKMLDTMEN